MSNLFSAFFVLWQQFVIVNERGAFHRRLLSLMLQTRPRAHLVMGRVKTVAQPVIHVTGTIRIALYYVY